MGLKELGTLVERTSLTCDELLPLQAGVLTQFGDLFEDYLLGLQAQIGAQLNSFVVSSDDFLDRLDQDRPLATAGGTPLATDADEVGIDTTGAALGVGDYQPAAALLAVLILLSIAG